MVHLRPDYTPVRRVGVGRRSHATASLGRTAVIVARNKSDPTVPTAPPSPPPFSNIWRPSILMLEVFLSGVGTVLHLERDAWSMVEGLMQVTTECPPQEER